MARNIIAHVRAGTTDLADDVVTFDPSIYVDADVAATERSQVFWTQPMVAAHASELADEGAFITVALNQTNVILTRRDGRIRAFVNACRHRGATLIEEPRGQRKSFTCKYHGWTYGNDGQLRAITFAETFGKLPCATTGLIALAVEERHGFVWVVEDPSTSIDVAAYLGSEMDQLLSELGLEDFAFYKGECIEFPQNWKVMLDGLLDSYHVRFLHGKTIAPFVYHNILAIDTISDHAFWGTPRKRIDEVIDDVPAEIELNRYLIFGIFLGPNTQLTLHPHHIEFWTVYQHPDGPHKSRAHLRFLTPQRIDTDEQRNILDKNYTILLNAVINEDVPAGNGIQASSGMGQLEYVMLGRNEVLNQVFHRTYTKLMQGKALGDEYAGGVAPPRDSAASSLAPVPMRPPLQPSGIQGA